MGVAAHRPPQRTVGIARRQRELIGTARARSRRKRGQRVGDAVPVHRLVDEDEGVEPADLRSASSQQRQRRLCIEPGGKVPVEHAHMIIGMLATNEFGKADAVSAGDGERQDRQQRAMQAAHRDHTQRQCMGNPGRLGKGADPALALIGRDDGPLFQRPPFGL